MLTSAWWRQDDRHPWQKTTADDMALLFSGAENPEERDDRFRCIACGRYLAFSPPTPSSPACFLHEDPNHDTLCALRLSEQKASATAELSEYRIRLAPGTFTLELGLPPVSPENYRAAIEGRLQFRIQDSSHGFVRLNLSDLEYVPSQMLWLPLPEDALLGFRIFYLPEGVCPLPWRAVPAPLADETLFFESAGGRRVPDIHAAISPEDLTLLVLTKLSGKHMPRFAEKEVLGKTSGGYTLYRLKLPDRTDETLQKLRAAFAQGSEESSAPEREEKDRTQTKPRSPEKTATAAPKEAQSPEVSPVPASLSLLWPPARREKDTFFTAPGIHFLQVAGMPKIRLEPDKGGSVQERIKPDVETTLFRLERKKKLTHVHLLWPSASCTLAFSEEKAGRTALPALTLTEPDGVPYDSPDDKATLPLSGTLYLLSAVHGKAELYDPYGLRGTWKLPAGERVKIEGLREGTRLLIRQGILLARQLHFDGKFVDLSLPSPPKSRVPKERRTKEELRDSAATPVTVPPAKTSAPFCVDTLEEDLMFDEGFPEEVPTDNADFADDVPAEESPIAEAPEASEEAPAQDEVFTAEDVSSPDTEEVPDPAPSFASLPKTAWRGRPSPLPRRYAWILTRFDPASADYMHLLRAFTSGTAPLGVLRALENIAKGKPAL